MATNRRNHNNNKDDIEGSGNYKSNNAADLMEEDLQN